MAPTKHSPLGASGAARWMACPGSVRLTKDLPDVESEYAREGTLAHKVAETELRGSQFDMVMLSSEFEKGDISKEMCEAVQIYVDEVRSHAGELHVEKEFSLEAIHPGMFGTCDAAVCDYINRILWVFDLKYGQGVNVDVEGNPQPMYYGVGALLEFGVDKFDTVECVIVQPRARDGEAIKRATYHTSELTNWVELQLRPAAKATENPYAILVTGDHCQKTFCKAFATCPQQREEALAVARTDFAAVVSDKGAQLPAIENLSNDEMVKVMQFSDRLAKWSKAIGAHVQEKAERGEKFDGVKLVRKRANRAWTCSEEELEDIFENAAYIEKLISVAQAEDLLKSDNRYDEADVIRVKELWHKPEGALTLAPDSDEREEVSVAPDFLPDDEMFT